MSGKIPLPEDVELKISTAQRAANFLLTDQNVELNYIHEKDRFSIKALSRDTQNIEAAFNDRLASLIRKYGSVSSLSLTRRSLRPPNFAIAFAILFSTLAVVGFFVAYPQYWQSLVLWYAVYGTDVTVGGIMLLAIVALFVATRRGRKRPK